MIASVDPVDRIKEILLSEYEYLDIDGISGHPVLRAGYQGGVLIVSHELNDRLAEDEFLDALDYLSSEDAERLLNWNVNFYAVGIIGASAVVNRLLQKLGPYSLMIDFPILILDATVRPLISADPAFDLYAWYWSWCRSPETVAKYYPE